MPDLKARSMFAALLVLVLFVGCKESANVVGKVTGGGKAVTGGDIIFRPVGEGARPAVGLIQSDGSYELKTAGNNPVTPGEYKLLYTAPFPLESATKMGPPSKWKNWKAPNDLVIVVEPGDNDVPIELKRIR